MFSLQCLTYPSVCLSGVLKLEYGVRPLNWPPTSASRQLFTFAASCLCIAVYAYVRQLQGQSIYSRHIANSFCFYLTDTITYQAGRLKNWLKMPANDEGIRGKCCLTS